MRIHWPIPLVPSLVLALTLPGCVMSEQGICPPDGGDEAIFDPALLGNWTLDTAEMARIKDGLKVDLGGKTLQFARIGEGARTYVVGTPVEPGQPANEPPNLGHLVPLGGARFLDVLVANPSAKDRPMHQLFKVSSTPETLSFHFMDPSYFWSHQPSPGSAAKASISGRLPLGRGLSPEFSFEPPTLTAPTSDLRKFLEEHANDPKLWPANWTIRLRRLPEGKPVPKPPITRTVSLAADGSIHLDGQPVPPAELLATLKTGAGDAPPRVVIVTAPEVAVSTLEPILAAAKAAGVASVRFEPAPVPSAKP